MITDDKIDTAVGANDISDKEEKTTDTKREFSGNGGVIFTESYTHYNGKNDVVKITIDTRNPESYAGYILNLNSQINLKSLNLHRSISFYILAENNYISHLLIRIKTKDGLEIQKELSAILIDQLPTISTQWLQISIDLSKPLWKLLHSLNLQNLEQICLALNHNNTDFSRNLVSFFIAEMS